MKSLKTKVIIPLLVIAVIGVVSSFWSLSYLKELGAAGNEMAAEHVPTIITLDAISANVEELQQLLLTHSVTSPEKSRYPGVSRTLTFISFHVRFATDPERENFLAISSES